MSREIDERLVAMRFDNQQFEEGVKESLASLAALREGLDLDGAADSFNEVSKASEKYLQFKEPVQAAANLQNSLSKIGSVAKAAFTGMTAPIKAVGNAINGVYKDISRLFGLDIAYNLEQSAIKTVRAFTTDPLTTGFQEYETKVDALRAIMSSTVEAYTKKMGGIYDEDMHRSEVKKKIEDLNKYADQTIYSFSDMMRSLPTLTNMGVDLDEAVSTVKGLHNLAALAGKGAAEASRALFNLGDAFSMGHFEAKDWKTMEYAGIATPDFKKIAIQVASKNGALIAKSGKYYAKEVTEKGIEKLHEVTVENFRDTLRYDWFDKKTIEDAFKIYSGELTELDLLSMGYRAANDREIIDWFLKIGKDAKTAASEVRTFTKMMDALKEAAQSGWATSYEYIFGIDKDATAFWSPISASISNILDESAKARNEALRGWSESDVDIDGTVKKTRDAVKDAIIQLVQAFATVKNAVSDAWSAIFGKFDKKRLADITKGFAKFASSLQKWLGNKSIKDSRINKISSALEGFFSVLNAVFGTVKDVFGWVGEKISPIFDWLFDKITSFGTLLQTKFKGTNNLKDVFNILKESSSGGIKTAVDWFSSIPEKISSKWQNFKNWFDGSALKDVLGNIWSGILGFFKAPEGSEDGKSGFDKAVEWLVGAYRTISAKWNEILKWWNNPDNKLHGAVDNIWSGILGFFKAPEGSEDGKSGFNKTVEWLVGAYETISAKWNEILKWWNNPDNKLHSTVDNIWSGILSFFAAPDTSFLSSISEFISELWKIISGLFFPENLADETKSAHEAISELGGIFTASASLTDASSGKKEIKKTFFDGILEYIAGLKQKFEALNIREFLSDLLGTIADFFAPQTVIGKQGNTWQTSPFIRLSDSISEGWEEFKAYPIWADIGAFLGNTWGWISSLFTEKVTVEKDDGTQEVHSKIGAKLDEIKSGIEKIFDTFKTSDIWKNIGELIKDPWGWIKKIAGIATEKVTGAVESVKSAIDSNPALNTIATFISTVFTSLKELIAEANGSELGQNFVSSLSSFFDAIGNFFKMAGDLLNIVLKDVSVVNRQYLWFAITKAILNISTALKDWKKSILTINRDSAGDAFIKFSASILMVSLAISTLGKMPIGQLAQGILAVGAVTVAITSIASAFKKIETGDSVKEMLKSGAVYLGGKLIDALGSMLTVVWTVSLVINNIDSILSSISKYKFESGKFLEVITGILEIAFGAALLAAMVSKFQFTPQTLVNVGYVIGSIAIALLGFLLMIAVIGNVIALDKEGFDRNVENFLLLFDALGRIVGAIIGGYTTEKMKGTANGISQAANIISQIPFDELELFFYAFGRLADIMDDVPDYTVFQKLFDTDGLSMLSEGMPKLAQGFKDFAGIASEVTDVSNVDKAVDFITKMAEATKTLAMADYIAFGYQGLNTRGLNSTDLMIDHFNDVLEFLGEAKLKSNGGYNFEGFFGQVGMLAKKINAGIEEAALGISADPIILGIAKGLLQSSGELTPAITQAIKDVYHGLNQIDSSVTSTGSTFIDDLFSQTEGLKESIPQFSSLFSVTDLQQSLDTVSTSLDFSGLKQTLSTNASEMSSILEGAFTLDGVDFNDDATSNLEMSWSSLFDTLKAEANSQLNDFVEIGRNISIGMANGIRASAGIPIATIRNICKAIISTAKAALGIRSPSKEFYEIGAYDIEGFMEGTESRVDSAIKGISAFANNYISTASDSLEKAVQADKTGISQDLLSLLLTSVFGPNPKTGNTEEAKGILTPYIEAICTSIETTINDPKLTEAINHLIQTTSTKLEEIITTNSGQVISMATALGELIQSVIGVAGPSITMAVDFINYIITLADMFANDIDENGNTKASQFVENLGDAIFNLLDAFSTWLVTPDIQTGKTPVEAVTEKLEEIVQLFATPSTVEMLTQLASMIKPIADILGPLISSFLTIASYKSPFKAAVGAVKTLGVFAELPEVIDSVKGIAEYGDAGAKAMFAVSALLTAVLAVITVGSMLHTNLSGAGSAILIGATIDAIVLEIEGLLDILGFFAEVDEGFADRVQKGAEVLSTLGAIPGGIIGAFIGAKDAQQTIRTAAGMAKATDAVDDVDLSKVEKLGTIMGVFNTVTKNLPDRTVWDLLVGTNVEKFADNMGHLGRGIASFYNNIVTITDYDALESATKAVETIAAAALILEQANDISPNNFVAYDMLDFLGRLSGVSLTPDNFSSYPEIDSIWSGLGENMAGALLAGFRSKAEELSLAISETIDTAPVITPVLDLGQFKRDAFGMRNLLPGTLSLNLAGAAVAPQDTSALSLEVLNRMADQNAAALTAMGQIMSDGLSSIGSMIGSIKFEMDGMAVGKAVFPYVNAELSRTLARYLRNNTTLRK